MNQPLSGVDRIDTALTAWDSSEVEFRQPWHHKGTWNLQVWGDI